MKADLSSTGTNHKIEAKTEPEDPMQDLGDYFYIFLAFHEPISFP